MSTDETPLPLWRARVKAWSRGLRDLRLKWRAAGRFSLLFGTLVLAPVVVLALLALRSITMEEAADRADLRAKASLMASQVHAGWGAALEEFEASLSRRRESRGSLIDSLSDLAPGLRGAFRLDQSGQPIAPFLLPPPTPSADAAPAWSKAVRVARRLEDEGSTRDARAAWERAARLAPSESLRAESKLGVARIANRQDRRDVRTWEQLAADPTRTRQGFRARDIARLELALHQLERSPTGAGEGLLALAEELLGSTWQIASGAEAVIVRHALDAVPNAESGDRVARLRTRLDQRAAELAWATTVHQELGVVAASHDPANPSVQYHAHANALWATIADGDHIVAYSFDYDHLAEAVGRNVERLHQLEPELIADVGHADREWPANALARRTLTPHVPFVDVRIVPSDPQGLEWRIWQRRALRALVLALAIGSTAVGVVIAARLVRRELETARMRSDFAAIVSHELRTPITKIRLKAESLMLDLVNDDQERQLHYSTINSEAELLTRLVDNVLDFASIERGSKRYAFRAQDLAEVVWRAVAALDEEFEANGMDVEVSLEEDLPPVWMDRDAIGQVLTNLLTNAVKYGSSGRWVGITARTSRDAVHVDIADRGMGISEDDLKNIFQHFYRSQDPEVRRRRGTGIGLSIVRYIVEAHGGRVSVDSVLGEGTTFHITLPMGPPEGSGT
jgi:signal transduction histidine kinase